VLELAIGALIVALIAGLLGSTDLARGALAVARFAFFVVPVIAALLFILVLLGLA
jgi:uncharacterized membrane protein YtjA (UPF0391 family)